MSKEEIGSSLPRILQTNEFVDAVEAVADEVCNLTVRQYFEKKLRSPVRETSVRHAGEDGWDMPIASQCGYACKLCIDAAARFEMFCDNAGTSCIELARDSVAVLIFG